MTIREQGMEMSETGDQAGVKPTRRRARKKAQTPARAFGRSLSDFEPLLPAEQKLMEAASRGRIAIIGDNRPEEATDENTVRAKFLRFLILGGDERVAVHERGPRAKGAWIDGVLDLENTETTSVIELKSCVFAKPIILRHSTIQGGLFLPTTTIAGIQGDGATILGSIVFADGFESSDKIRFVGVQLHGSLTCKNSKINGNGGDALVADRAIIKGSLHFIEGFTAIGTVRLVGAQINGNFECRNSKISSDYSNALAADNAVIGGCMFISDGFKAVGTVRLPGAQIGADFLCVDAELSGHEKLYFFAQGMRVAGGFMFRNFANPVNGVDLSAASVETLVDDASAWGKDLTLDGFSYRRIGGGAPTSAADRLAWLDKQKSGMTGLTSAGSNFRPQPWKQLQKVLREMGHNEDARQVAIAFEHRLRKADLIGVAPPQWGWLRRKLYRHLSRFFHWCFWALTGYGYRPMRLMVWMLAMWLGSAAFYWFTALTQPYVFAPSNPLVFQHPQYQVCAPETPESKAELAKPPNKRSVVGAGNWYLCEKLRGEYTGFSPLAYSLDVLLPLVDLQQQKDWGPIIPTPKSSWWRELFAPSWGHAARLVIWFQTLFGWVASLLLVAIVSGLTKRRED